MPTDTDALSGDRVNFEDNERLDKDDAHLMQELGQELVTRSLGAVLGTAGSDGQRYGGILEGITTSWDGTTKRLTLGAGLFLDSQAGSSPNAAPIARVVRHDPTTPGQNSGVDLSAQASGSATCIIWGKRSLVGGPLQSRKFWSVGDSAERTSSLATTKRERVVFVVAEATFSGSTVTAYTVPSGGGWFPVVGIRAWSTGTPTVLLLSAFDAWRGNGSALGDVGSTRLATHALLGGGFSLGLLRLLRNVRLALANITAQDGTVSWLAQAVTPTYRGLKELDTDLAQAESVAGDVEARTQSCLVAAGQVYKTGGVWTLRYHRNVTSLTRVSSGLFTMQVTSMQGMSDFAGVFVELLEYDSDPSVLLHHRATVTPNPGGLVTIRIRDNAGVATDPSDEGFWFSVAAVL